MHVKQEYSEAGKEKERAYGVALAMLRLSRGTVQVFDAL